MPMRYFRNPLLIGLLAALLCLGCSSCSLPQVNAEERLFLPLTVDFLDEYIIPTADYEGTQVGGLSAITYDRQLDRLYALSDDRGAIAPPRFYTLQLKLASETAEAVPGDASERSDAGINEALSLSINSPSITIDSIDIESVTFLSMEDGSPFPTDTVDPEGMVLSPQGTLFISSEGVSRDRIPPWIAEFDRNSGQQLRRLPIPTKYIPADGTSSSPEQSSDSAATDPLAPDPLANDSANRQVVGIRNNLGFEALALSASGMGMGNDEPFRVFAGIEEPLQQDAEVTDSANPQPGRILHYVVSPDQSFPLSEHVYPIDPLPFGAVNTGLVELLAINQGGHFLSLERAYGLGGVRAKLFQLVFSDATDTATLTTLPPNLEGIQLLRKQLVLDLYDLGITLDNLEGMTLGPRLSDGSQSLILISDNNFSPETQVNQVLLFRINGL